MFMELCEHNRAYEGKEYGEEYSKEFEKFKKDPYNYSLPKNAVNTIEGSDLLTDQKSRSKEDHERAKDTATLGIKALNKMGMQGSEDENHITGNDREWFLFEDQTIGLPAVADLVRQGKSNSQIKTLINEASNAKDHAYDSGYFELSNLAYYVDNNSNNPNNFLDKYMNTCRDLIKDPNWKN